MRMLIEKWYIIFSLLKISKNNQFRNKFEKRMNNYFILQGQGLECLELKKYYEINNILYKKVDKNIFIKLSDCKEINRYGVVEYIDKHIADNQTAFGTVYTKTPFRNLWIESPYIEFND